MIKDGKSLENLVKQVEELLVPEGFVVSSNEKIFNDDGVQIAEFDIEVRGKVGSTTIVWLIECRDRPSSGAAPGSWIEQLVGRRQRFGFNKVTAVSTTGFASGVEKFAEESGIELRTVESIGIEEISHWMGMSEMTQHIRHINLKHLRLFISEDTPKNLRTAFENLITSQTGDPKILQSSETREFITCSQAFEAAAASQGNPFEGLEENGEPRSVNIHAVYNNDSSHYLVNTVEGPVRIMSILFQGEFSLKTKKIPIANIQQYQGSETTPISQSATFPLEINKESYSIEFHKLGDTGETHVLLRKNKT